MGFVFLKKIQERFLTGKGGGRGHWGFIPRYTVSWFGFHMGGEMIQGSKGKERRQGSNSPESPVN